MVLGTIGHVDHGKVCSMSLGANQQLTFLVDHIDGCDHEETGREGNGKLLRIWRDR